MTPGWEQEWRVQRISGRWPQAHSGYFVSSIVSSLHGRWWEADRGRTQQATFPLPPLPTTGCFSLTGVTGGLAAPLVAAGAATIIGSAGAAALGSVAGIAIMTSLFGAAGAGLTGKAQKQ